MSLHPQAEQLRTALTGNNDSVYRLLSRRGKAVFFPSEGILAQTAQAKKAEINATIGIALENDRTPMCLSALAERIDLERSQVFPYAPPFGRPELREIWQQRIRRNNPSLGQAIISTPVVTSALTHGLSLTGYLFVDPDEAIIVPDLFWGNYRLVYQYGWDARFDTYPMFTPEGALNTNGLRERLLAGEPGKRIVLLNFPNNPTGYTASEAEAKKIHEVCMEAAEEGNDLVVILDDAYFGLVYEDGIFRESLFALLANTHPRILAVKLDGPTKEDYVWGFRVGFMTFGVRNGSPELYEALESKVAAIIRGNISNVSNPGQSLLAAAYSDPEYEEEKQEKYRTLHERYCQIRSILKKHPEYAEIMEPLPFNSGYFMCLKTVFESTEPLRRLLLAEYGTGLIAMNNMIRIAFSSTPLDQLEKLFSNVYQAGKRLLSES